MTKTICVALLLLMSGPVLAHPGKTDRQGGHKCWKNCEEWELFFSEYHLHDKEGNPIRLNATGNPVPPLPSQEPPPPVEVQTPSAPPVLVPRADAAPEERTPGQENVPAAERPYRAMITEEPMLPFQSILLMALVVLLLLALVFLRKKRDRD
jgi:hypothetical protein